MTYKTKNGGSNDCSSLCKSGSYLYDLKKAKLIPSDCKHPHECVNKVTGD